MTEETGPAATAVLEAPPDGTGEKAPESGAPAADKPQSAAPAPATPTAEAPKESPPAPDYKSLADQLLGSPEGRKLLLAHPELAREIDHRASSEAGRRAKSQLEEYQRQAAESAERRTLESAKRLIEEDPNHPLAQWAQGLIEQRSQALVAAEKERAAAEEATRRDGLLAEVYGNVGRQMYEALATKFKLDGPDGAVPDPRGFPSFGEWVAALVDAVGERKAKAALSAMLPKERDAIRAEMRGEGLDKEPTPPKLPQGDGTSYASADDVRLAYIEGKFGSAADPHGGVAMKRYAEALKAFGEEP